MHNDDDHEDHPRAANYAYVDTATRARVYVRAYARE